MPAGTQSPRQVKLLADMLPDLAAIQDLTAAHPYQRDLASVAARMAGLTSALLTDLGEPGKARHWLSVLDGYAQQAGDTRTRTWGHAAGAVLEPTTPRPHGSWPSRAQAIPAAHGLASAGTVMLYALRGWALAASGDRAAAIRALAAAAELHSRLAEAEAEDYMWGFPAQQLRWYESRTFTLTGDLDRAAEARTEALRLYPASDQVDRVLLLLDAAACALAAGEPDQEASTAAQAMAAVPTERRTNVVSRRAAELSHDLSPYRALTPVRDLDDIRQTWTAT